MSNRYNVLRCLLSLLLFSSSQFSYSTYQLEDVAKNLNSPWSVTQLPNGDFLLTEKPGTLLRISKTGEKKIVSGTPATFFKSQGGFFDVQLHPNFENNQLIYLSFAEGNKEANGTAVIRGKLDGLQLLNAETVLRVRTQKDTPAHYGGRMLFLPDGTLLISTGDGFEYREASQDIKSELGKVLRINGDGSIPSNNPYQETESAKIWTYGHRNPQGLALQKSTGTIYLHEHGPKGGDELNILTAGYNFGWPAITYGIDYSGAIISPFTEAPGMEQPVHYWVPSIAPSGMAFYEGDQFPNWKGNLFIGALVNKEVRRLSIDQDKIVNEEPVFQETGQRIRDVRVFPDGYIYLLTDSEEEGRLIRVKPKSL